MANISSYNQLSSWNEDDDLLFVQQPDAPKKAHPSQIKQYVEAGDFEATGEIIDGHGNILKDMAKSADVDAEIGDLSQTGLTGDSVAAQLAYAGVKITNKVKKIPTQTTRYNFTAAKTYEYTGVNVTCPAGHTYIVRATLVFSNSEPKGIVASARSDTMRMYECYVQEELSSRITFMLVEGESAYIWGKGAAVASDDIRLDVIDITN